MSEDTLNPISVREALVSVDRPKPASALSAVGGFDRAVFDRSVCGQCLVGEGGHLRQAPHW